MKKFFTKLILFFLILGGLDHSFIIFRKKNVNLFADIASEKVKMMGIDLLSSGFNPEVLVMGSSHVQFGVDTQVLSNETNLESYNAGFGWGTNIYIQKNFLKDYLSLKEAPRLIGRELGGGALVRVGAGRVLDPIRLEAAKAAVLAPLARLPRRASPQSRPPQRMGCHLDCAHLDLYGAGRRTLQPIPPYGSMELSRQSLSKAQVISSPVAVSPAHTFGQNFPSHSFWHARHSARVKRSALASTAGRHEAASKASSRCSEGATIDEPKNIPMRR